MSETVEVGAHAQCERGRTAQSETLFDREKVFTPNLESRSGRFRLRPRLRSVCSSRGASAICGRELYRVRIQEFRARTWACLTFREEPRSTRSWTISAAPNTNSPPHTMNWKSSIDG